MSLFGNNNGSKCSGGATLFRDSGKIINLNNIVTQVVTKNVTERIERSNLLYKNLYDDVGVNIKNILTAFVTGSDELKTLIDYENYNALADKLHSHLNEDNKDLENFRNLLIDAVEGAKKSSNRILEQEFAYKKLLDAYNSLLADERPSNMILEAEASMTVSAMVKPEVLEYIRRGYQIVDEDGNLIPMDMTILAEIRKDLDITNTNINKDLGNKEIRKDLDITNINKDLGTRVSRWALKPNNTEYRRDYKHPPRPHRHVYIRTYSSINELYIKATNPVPTSMPNIMTKNTEVVTNNL